jgi:hypothetical protein
MDISGERTATLPITTIFQTALQVFTVILLPDVTCLNRYRVFLEEDKVDKKRVFFPAFWRASS